MAIILHGERIAAQGKLGIGCSAFILDASGRKVLLTRRTDNGRWCLPGGWMEAGESVAEACAREVREETGLEVQVGRLIGVYSSPHRMVTYADGNQYHLVGLFFAAEVVGGTLGLSNETTEWGYFSPAEVETLDLMEHHRERVLDGWLGSQAALVR
jgi:ADP-ribose pyrophosphatase YjhB (NUDIX family)